jgi:hypothetical protein
MFHCTGLLWYRIGATCWGPCDDSVGFQVTTLLSEADRRIKETAAGGKQWLEEATAAAEAVKASAAQEAEQGEKIRKLKEQMKEASGEAKSELNKQVQVEVKALKSLKEATAGAQDKCAFLQFNDFRVCHFLKLCTT